MPEKRTREVTGGAKATVDHEEIRNWVESHGGAPAMVKRTRQQAKGPGILRIDFPGSSGEATLEHVSWGEWFDHFEQSELAFLYQDRTATGRPSRFNKLVGRETVEIAPTRRARRAPKKGAPRRSAKTAATPKRTAAAATPRATTSAKQRATRGTKPTRRASAAPKRTPKRTSKTRRSAQRASAK